MKRDKPRFAKRRSLRERLSVKLLGRFERHTPALLRSIQIQILTSLAAESFGLRRRQVWMLPAGLALRKYARFTVYCMEHMNVTPEHLYRMAYRLGDRVRHISGLREREHLQRLVFLLYRNIGITMEGSLPGKIRVPQCYFSRYYHPGQCALMSAVDSGIVSGIFGGGRLTFCSRITEGSPCCRACLK